MFHVKHRRQGDHIPNPKPTNFRRPLPTPLTSYFIHQPPFHVEHTSVTCTQRTFFYPLVSYPATPSVLVSIVRQSLSISCMSSFLSPRHPQPPPQLAPLAAHSTQSNLLWISPFHHFPDNARSHPQLPLPSCLLNHCSNSNSLLFRPRHLYTKTPCHSNILPTKSRITITFPLLTNAPHKLIRQKDSALNLCLLYLHLILFLVNFYPVTQAFNKIIFAKTIARNVITSAFRQGGRIYFIGCN